MEPIENERLAVLETEVFTIKQDVSEIKGDVKQLLGFMHKTYGATGLLSLFSARALAAIAVAIAAASLAMRFIH